MTHVIFDLDGTLLDSAPDIHAAGNAALARNGAGAITLEQTRQFIGNGAKTFVARMLAAVGQPDSEEVHAQYFATFLEHYEGDIQFTTLYPGVEDVLAHLHGQQVRMGVCTNKPVGATQAVLKHFNLTRYFPVVLGGDSLPQCKPDPAPLLKVMADMGADPARDPVLFVGDSDVDAETAKRAAVPFALFTEGYRKSPVEALPHDWAFSHFADLTRIVGQVQTRGAA